MPKSHLFVIDPIKDLNLTLDTSIRLAQALCRFGYYVFFTQSQLLGLSSQLGPYAKISRFYPHSDHPDGFELGKPEVKALTHMAAVHMRKDPPTDDKYWTATWILSQLANKVQTFNAPEALRSINEKLSIFEFPEASHPALVTSSPQEIESFGREFCHNDMIIKPLTLYGGRGVERVILPAKGPLPKETLNNLTENGTCARIIQPFNKAIFDGEIRVFSAFGTPISWCKKVPKDGEFLANTSMGATLEDFVPSKKLTHTIETISKTLIKRGVFFCGFDLIGEKVSEINITSPRLLAKDLDPSLFDQMTSLIAKHIGDKKTP